MTFQATDSQIGLPTVDDVSTTAKVRLGTIAEFIDPDLGSGEFIYLEGVVNTTAGNVVTYDDSFQTALSTTTLALPRPVAVAMAATVADRYGWYQIGGIATLKKANTVSFAKAAALASGSGLAIAVVSGLILNGALVAVVASAKSDVTTVKVMVNRPHDPSDVS
jgi:hypothetical protein